MDLVTNDSSITAASPFDNPCNSLLPYLVSSSQGFCNDSNINTCLSLISQEFLTLGFQPVFEDSSSHTIDCNMVNFINNIFELLFSYRNCTESSSVLEQSNQRLNSDVNALNSKLNARKTALEQLERKYFSLQEKERQMNEKIRKLESQLKVQKDECKRLSQVLQHQKQFFEHELKKQERQNCQMKEKLQQMLKSSDRKYECIEMTHTLPRKSNQRGKWKTASSTQLHLEEMYKSVISSFDNHCRQKQKQLSLLQESLKFVRDDIILISDLLLNCPKNPETESSTGLLSEKGLLSCDQLQQKALSIIQSLKGILVDLNYTKSDRQHEKTSDMEMKTLNETISNAAKDETIQGVKCTYDDVHNVLQNQLKVLKEKQHIANEMAIIRQVADQLKQDRACFENEKFEFLNREVGMHFYPNECLTFSSVPVVTSCEGTIKEPSGNEYQYFLQTANDLGSCTLPSWVGSDLTSVSLVPP